MPRKPRVHAPGGVYHAILRGNGGEDIFFSAADRHEFYRLLEIGVCRFGHRVHAFCLMSNHVHLVLQAGETPLSRPMQTLSSRYARWINRRTGRAGHVFQGRYKALLVDADAYLLELIRYVHLNPMRAGAAARAEAYPWTSHRAYLGIESLPWLTTDWALSLFGRREATARARYRDFIAAGAGEGRRAEFHDGADDSRVLGDDRFTERALGAAGAPSPTPEPDKVVAAVCAAFGVAEHVLAGPSRRRHHALARGVAGLLATTTRACTLSDVARRFNRDVSALSRAARAAEERGMRDAAFGHRLAELENAIMQT